MRNFGNINYNNKLPFSAPPAKESNPIFARIINKFHNKINPPVPIKFNINEETKILLDNYFYEEIVGIDELVDKNILSKWFPDKTIANNV